MDGRTYEHCDLQTNSAQRGQVCDKLQSLVFPQCTSKQASFATYCKIKQKCFPSVLADFLKLCHQETMPAAQPS